MRISGKLASGIFLLMVLASVVSADICLIVYPQEPCVYHYKASRYYTVGPGHELYDPEYDRGGEVLIEEETGQIPLEIYRGNIVGFEATSGSHYGFEITSSPCHLVVEALSDEPAVYENITLAFLFLPDGCHPDVTINGTVVPNKRHLLGDLLVNQDEGDGYSGQIDVEMTFYGCTGANIWAFADEDGDLQQDSEECTSSYLYHIFLPTEEVSWSAVKSFY